MQILISYFKFLTKMRIVTSLRSLILFFFKTSANKTKWEKRILLINLQALGDLIVFTSVLKHYKERWPEKELYLLIKAGTGMEQLFKEKFVDRVLMVDYRRFAIDPIYGAKFINRLRKIGFLKVINHDFSAAEVMGKIIATNVGADKVEGYEGIGLEFRIPFDFQQRKNLRIVANKIYPKYTCLIRRIDTSPPSLFRLPSAISHYIAIYEGVTGEKEDDYSTTLGDFFFESETLAKFGLKRKDYAVLVLGASLPYKRWPLENFVQLAEFLNKEGIQVVVSGSAAEEQLANSFASMSRAPVINLAGQTSFKDFVGLIKNSLIVLASDTSSVHIAVAEKTPSLCIAGGGFFGMFSEYGYKDINRWVYKELPCFGDNWHCSLKVKMGEPVPCIAAVKVENVLRELESFLLYIRKEKKIPNSKFSIGFTPPPPENHKFKIVYTGLESENYNPERRPSFEYENFYLSLKNMPGAQVIEYPYEMIATLGKKKFNEELLRLVREVKPDLFFAFMFTDELTIRTLEQIKQLTTSLAWFADDHWRLWNYSRYYAPHFTWAVTTWSAAPEIYAKYGIKNVIRSQWAANPKYWQPINAPRDIDVSFIGQRNSAREKIIKDLRHAGINVWVAGWGWSEGRLSCEEIVRSISRSKINLNFNAPPERWRLRLLGRLFLRRSCGRIVPDFGRVMDNFKSWMHMSVPQIKARPFEILACHAFLISGYADDMDQYYEDGKEIVYYDGSVEDLVRKIRYYGNREAERKRIAQAGYERTIREHTYEKRFEEIFRKMGLKL